MLIPGLTGSLALGMSCSHGPFFPDRSVTDEMAAKFEKAQPINDELEKLGTWTWTSPIIVDGELS